jgi:hypothetical protein
MAKQSRLKQYLLILDNLIQRERTAIIYSQMDRLEKIQHEKNSLLIMMQNVEKVMDQESFDLAIKIKKNNRRNALLLKAGFKLIRTLRQDVNRRRSLTYSAGGHSRNLSICPKILKQRV